MRRVELDEEHRERLLRFRASSEKEAEQMDADVTHVLLSESHNTPATDLPKESPTSQTTPPDTIETDTTNTTDVLTEPPATDLPTEPPSSQTTETDTSQTRTDKMDTEQTPLPTDPLTAAPSDPMETDSTPYHS
eukprot:TRINITY_DN5585_c0_g1_i1.p1 TRINITY_DN5585_c0_g1~~TRINITY_DN5585_c0_g1_i1.p1  ORF type:complete len:134 (-),score=37.98 TRINITY_DN5585_c0_g1_i1:39-440(-)